MSAAQATRARYTSHVVRHTAASPALLADYLAAFRERGQGAWPSQKHLAKRFGVSVRTIQRWLNKLYAAALLAVERHKPHHDHITGRWRRRTNRYRCTFQKTKRARPPEKDLLTPRRHECRHEAPYRAPCIEAAPPPVISPPPWAIEGITAAEWTRRKIGRP